MKVMTSSDFNNIDDVRMYYCGTFLGFREGDKKTPCYIRDFMPEDDFDSEDERSSYRFYADYFDDHSNRVRSKVFTEQELIPYPPYTGYIRGTLSWLYYQPHSSYKKGLTNSGLFYSNPYPYGEAPSSNIETKLKGMYFDEPEKTRIINNGEAIFHRGKLVTNERLIKCLNLKKISSESRLKLNVTKDTEDSLKSLTGTSSRMEASETVVNMSSEILARERDFLRQYRGSASRLDRSRLSDLPQGPLPTSTVTSGT